MAQLRRDYATLQARSVEPVVLGPDSPERFAQYWAKHDLPFRGLPDPSASVLKLYGQEVNLFKLGRMPAMVLVDREGVVRSAHYGRTMADIPAVSDILADIEG
ncbi:MAG: redoxin domain-containing protein [Armatimonadetes bacterium]|nr:redoxin domain-containing protein [Armatimonadota bacterium]